MFGSGNPLSRLANLGSSIYGMYQSEQQRKLAKKAAEMSDPFGKYRGGYAAMLAKMYRDPNSIKSMPGYQFQLDAGLDAVQRKMAASGYRGSGNEAIALNNFAQDYAGGYFNNEVGRLSQLAGAQFGPGTSGSLLLQGNMGANDLASRALASLGYTLNSGGGGSAQNILIQQLLSRMMA